MSASEKSAGDAPRRGAPRKAAAKPGLKPDPTAVRAAAPAPDTALDPQAEADRDRLRRRARFLRDLHEAKELRERVQPRRARVARMRQAMRMRTFRW